MDGVFETDSQQFVNLDLDSVEYIIEDGALLLVQPGEEAFVAATAKGTICCTFVFPWAVSDNSTTRLSEGAALASRACA